MVIPSIDKPLIGAALEGKKREKRDKAEISWAPAEGKESVRALASSRRDSE